MTQKMPQISIDIQAWVVLNVAVKYTLKLLLYNIKNIHLNVENSNTTQTETVSLPPNSSPVHKRSVTVCGRHCRSFIWKKYFIIIFINNKFYLLRSINTAMFEIDLCTSHWLPLWLSRPTETFPTVNMFHKLILANAVQKQPI